MNPDQANNTKNLPASQADYSIAVRFGSAVLEAGHTSIPNLVLRHYAKLGVTSGELVFMMLCLQHKWFRENPHPSLGTIAARMGVSRRQARSYASGLKGKGLLAIEERVDPKLGQLSSVYDFTPLLAAVVKLEGGGTPPRKDSSYPPRKDPSAEENKDQEEALASNCARAREGGAEKDCEPGKRKATARSAALPGAPTPSRGLASIREVLRTRGLGTRSSVSGTASAPELTRPSIGAEITRSLAPGREDLPYLKAAIREVTRELGDDGHLASNLAQARNLMGRSKLGERDFVEHVFQARALVKERRLSAGPRLRRQGAYFFFVLRDLLSPKANAAPAVQKHAQSPGSWQRGERNYGVTRDRRWRRAKPATLIQCTS